MTTKLAFNLLAVSCLAMAPAFAQSSDAQEEDSFRYGMPLEIARTSSNSHKMTEARGRFRART